MNIFRGNIFVIAARVILAIVFIWTVSFLANLFTCYPITPFFEQFYGRECTRLIFSFQTIILLYCILHLVFATSYAWMKLPGGK
jgi:hypothetical protein